MRVRELRSMAAWIQLTSQFAAEVKAVTARWVVCADFRNLEVMSPAIDDAWIDCVAQAGARLERSAIILPRGEPALKLRIERSVREALHLGRRVCSDSTEAKNWLAPCLSTLERARLDDFLMLDTK